MPLRKWPQVQPLPRRCSHSAGHHENTLFDCKIGDKN
jgi:hypothetical protein